MADFKLRAPPRLRFYGAVTVDGVIGSGGSVALAGDAVARAQGVAALLRGINLGGAASASSQAAAALFKAANLSSVAIAGASATGDLGGPDADWAARSTATGVVFANRLQSQSDLNAWLSPDAPSAANCSIDTAVKVPGATASFKVAILDGAGANAGAFRIFFGSLAEFGDGDTVWFSFRVRAPAQAIYQVWPGVGPPSGNKLCIFSRWTASNQVNEVVLTQTAGMIDGYYQNGFGYVQIEEPFTSAAGADFRWQTDVDLGANPLSGTNPDTGAAWTAYEQQRRQYGELYLARQAANWRQGFGDPLAKIFRQFPDEWITLTTRLVIGNFGVANNRWTTWAAREGQPYQKLFDRQNIRLGAGPNYDALWLLPYATNRTSGGKKVESRGNTFTGAEILTVGLSTPTGAGTLEYNATTQRFRWAGNGESFGTARGFSAANDILTLNVTSGTATDSFLVVKVTPALLPPTGVVTDTINITDGRPDTQTNYNDVIISTQPIAAAGGFWPGSSLATAVNSMPAGTWVNFPLPNQTAVIGSQPGGGTLIQYSNEMPWNPINRRVEILSAYHQGATPGMRFVYYDEVTHNCVQLIDQPAVPGIGHGFNHSCVNPATGDYYHKQWGGGASVYRKTAAASSLSLLTSAPLSQTNIQYPVCWWSGAFTGAGAQGCMVIWNEASSTGQIIAYDPLSATWFFNQAGKAPQHTSQYNGIMCYSPVKNCAIYGGGNSANKVLYRLNSDGTFLRMPDMPASFNGNVGYCLTAADPATGNFLLFSNGELWELNPTGSGTWTQLTGSRAIPATLSRPGDGTGFKDAIVCAIPAHDEVLFGVIMYIMQDTGTSGDCWLYRHT